MRKMMDFKGIADQVQAYADSHYEGNFSLAVRKLLEKSLKKDGKNTKKEWAGPKFEGSK